MSGKIRNVYTFTSPGWQGAGVDVNTGKPLLPGPDEGFTVGRPPAVVLEVVNVDGPGKLPACAVRIETGVFGCLHISVAAVASAERGAPREAIHLEIHDRAVLENLCEACFTALLESDNEKA